MMMITMMIIAIWMTVMMISDKAMVTLLISASTLWAKDKTEEVKVDDSDDIEDEGHQLWLW